ncbi:MAG: LysM peptidoglycan-binding domain-containing protein [Clostridia bacterium]|nr:LysM peptidoglycan-binding domain-containing protein [Clostridia bacterium]
MILYTVKPGDTVFSIAQRNGTSPSRIIIDNDLTNPEKLVVGQTLVLLYPTRTYTVRGGDTLNAIANMYGTTLLSLWQNNPSLRGRSYIYPGQTLNISFETPPLGSIRVNGYAYPYIDRSVLRTTLPYLTYLSIFTYGFRPDGSLIAPTGGDQELISIAKEYGTIPLMMLTSLTEMGTFSNELVASLLADRNLQNTVTENTLRVIREKGYGGLDMDFEYIPAQFAEEYALFLTNLRTKLEAEGYILFASLAPKTSATQRGLLYEGHDYGAVGAAANYVLLMTYEWGYTYGPPLAVAPIPNVRRVLDYAVTEIPREKIFLGVPNYAYNWTLPYVRGESRAEALSNVAAVQLAAEKNAEIRLDKTSMAPTFSYYEFSAAENKALEHEVWFEDAKSIDEKLRLVNEYGLRGVSIWQIMKYFPQLWLVLHSLYSIEKL